VCWQVQEPAELAYWFGHAPVHTVVRQGKVFANP
jgi:imidazolonepropionase